MKHNLHPAPCFDTVMRQNREYGYIIESVIDCKKEEIHFCGSLMLDCIQCCMYRPVCISKISVLRIEPICMSNHADTFRKQRLRLRILCTILDEDGCTHEEFASFDLDCRKDGEGHRDCLATLRRGASIEVISSQPCGCHAFQVSLKIDMLTVLSQAEYVGSGRYTCLDKQLPLYPVPCKNICKRCR